MPRPCTGKKQQTDNIRKSHTPEVPPVPGDFRVSVNGVQLSICKSIGETRHLVRRLNDVYKVECLHKNGEWRVINVN